MTHSTIWSDGADEVRFSSIQTDEIAAVAQADREAYGDEALSEERLAQWLQRYPDGAIIAWHQDKIAGSVGLWPMTQAAYLGLRDGRIHENDIGPDLFPSVDQEHPSSFWTLAAIYIHPDYRGGQLLPELLKRSFGRLAQSGHTCGDLSILGLGFSEGGIRTLTRLGFDQYGPTRESLSPYELHLSDDALKAMPDQIDEAYGHRRLLRPCINPECDGPCV